LQGIFEICETQHNSELLICFGSIFLLIRCSFQIICNLDILRLVENRLEQLTFSLRFSLIRLDLSIFVSWYQSNRLESCKRSKNVSHFSFSCIWRNPLDINRVGGPFRDLKKVSSKETFNRISQKCICLTLESFLSWQRSHAWRLNRLLSRYSSNRSLQLLLQSQSCSFSNI